MIIEPFPIRMVIERFCFDRSRARWRSGNACSEHRQREQSQAETKFHEPIDDFLPRTLQREWNGDNGHAYDDTTQGKKVYCGGPAPEVGIFRKTIWWQEGFRHKTRGLRLFYGSLSVNTLGLINIKDS